MKEFIAESERLLYREIIPEDSNDLFLLDTNPEVHRFLGNNTFKFIGQTHEMIANIRQQYVNNGIGRWATIEKTSGIFIGWSGLKFITTIENNRTNFYDVGYRLLPKYWGKGYASEATATALTYGFLKMNLNEIIGTCHEENSASRRVLEKNGLKFSEKYKWKDLICDWLSISKTEWLILNNID
jgi:ribosomal-protein-alanine N-acetyltransferase